MDFVATHETDAALVGRATKGDVNAFVELVKRHERSVWRIATQTLLDRSLCENLVQQVFLNVYEHLHSFDQTRDFGVWLRSVARNLARDELRKASRHHRHLAAYQHHLQELLQESGGDDGGATIGLETALRRCREGLTSKARQVLSLRYENSLSLPEIADAIGRSLAATRQLLFRTRLALRACVEQQSKHQ
ncbi:MAG: RNA polymerase sigma factor [Deltaproteobacteria bacterium]|nr:RNA polymerase sigma factor [Deltaproteobacteria bacterium]